MRKIVVTVTEEALTTTDYLYFEGTACVSERERFHTLLSQFGVQVQTTSTIPKSELLNALASQQEVIAQEVQQEGMEG
jgi:hypothetical protein